MSGTFVVSTSYGPVRGNKRVSCVGDTFFSFRGIPYAKPPLRALRFKVGDVNLSLTVESLSRSFACVMDNLRIQLNTKHRIPKFPSRGFCPGM